MVEVSTVLVGRIKQTCFDITSAGKLLEEHKQSQALHYHQKISRGPSFISGDLKVKAEEIAKVKDHILNKFQGQNEIGMS